MGGEQTDAFLFYPPDLHVPETRCSTDMFHILNGYRSAGPGPAPAVPTLAPGESRDWSPAVLLRGLRRPRLWLGLALRCLLLVIAVYLLGGVLLYSLVWGAGFTWQTLPQAAQMTPQ